MSDPVTQSEVEDVLSSIRRLVGETRRAAPLAVARPVASKLVLTPQLRVDEAEEANAAPHEENASMSFEQADVFVLRQENAIETETDAEAPEDWSAYEEPPLAPLPETAEARRDVAPAEAAARPRRPDVLELTAKIAALEKAIASTVDQWEPDGAGRDAYAGTQMPAMTWQENVELDATGTPVGAPKRAGKPPSASRAQPETAHKASAVEAEAALEDALEEQVIDEETLRAMVAEIVRSELQGPLGERITRNVRKLVRREIHRALISLRLE